MKMRTLLLTTYYQLLIFTRVKVAVFFSFVFPVFLFIVFSFIWGRHNPDYSKFLLTGIIIMKVTSDALFSIGGAIVGYLQGGVLKFLKGLPTSVMVHLWALILSRALIAIVTSAALTGIGIWFFKIEFQPMELLYIFFGIAGAFIIFSFLSLTISFLAKDKSGDISLTNFVYFIMIFLSDIFYPLSELNPALGKIAAFLPTGPVIALTRGDAESGVWTLVWALIVAVIFYFSFKNHKIGR